jgi:GntR family transcriptional regulator, transcriptional repressor for pyruvate dehydrogenase complex
MTDILTEKRSARGMMDSTQTLKLSDIVYAKIAGQIRSGEYPVDSRLPTENELAEWLGVSRPIVREALARLRNEGVVVSRRGSGTYVQQVHGGSENEHTPLTSIADMRRCLEYRISLEGEAAWHAARGSEDDRAALHEAIAQLDRDQTQQVLQVESDFGFHLSVAIATGNRFFADTLSLLRNSIVTAMAITPNFVRAQSDQRLARIFDEHRAVYDAICANDAEAARNAMRNHLTKAMTRVFEGV